MNEEDELVMCLKVLGVLLVLFLVVRAFLDAAFPCRCNKCTEEKENEERIRWENSRRRQEAYEEREMRKNSHHRWWS